MIISGLRIHASDIIYSKTTMNDGIPEKLEWQSVTRLKSPYVQTLYHGTKKYSARVAVLCCPPWTQEGYTCTLVIHCPIGDIYGLEHADRSSIIAWRRPSWYTRPC